jgi:hypothetical protein
VEPVEVLGAIGILEGVNVTRASGVSVVYYRAGGGSIPLAALYGDRASWYIAGLVTAVIDYQARLSEHGKTPWLPPWIHPYTISLIPAKAEHSEYARSVAIQLARRSANVLILEPTVGLGARIRWAGRRWIPYVGVVGSREASTGTVTVRRRNRPGEQETVEIASLVEEISGLLSAHGVAGRVLNVSI